MSQKRIMRVEDVMERDFSLIQGIATVAEALALMREKERHFLLVDKRSEDDEYGIVLVADIAKRVLALDRAPERTNVYEIMSKPVIAVRPAMDVRYCARLFGRFGLSTAPVMDGDTIRGVVTYDRLVLKGLV